MKGEGGDISLGSSGYKIIIYKIKICDTDICSQLWATKELNLRKDKSFMYKMYKEKCRLILCICRGKETDYKFMFLGRNPL